MSSLLHIVPLRALWVQWDSPDRRGCNGPRNLDTLVSQDYSNTVIIGHDASGKTSLAFQAAVTLATENMRVTFLRPKALSRLPLTVHGMPGPEPAALQLVKFWYPEHVEDVVKWCGHMHTQVVLPDVIIVDDLHVFAAQAKSAEYGIARLFAALTDAAAWIQSKSSLCRLILTASHRITSLDSVSRQFQFNIVRLAESTIGEDGKSNWPSWTLTSGRPTYSLSIHYSFTQHNIFLNSVDFNITSL